MTRKINLCKINYLCDTNITIVSPPQKIKIKKRRKERFFCSKKVTLKAERKSSFTPLTAQLLIFFLYIEQMCFVISALCFVFCFYAFLFYCKVQRKALVLFSFHHFLRTQFTFQYCTLASNIAFSVKYGQYCTL